MPDTHDDGFRYVDVARYAGKFIASRNPDARGFNRLTDEQIAAIDLFITYLMHQDLTLFDGRVRNV